MRSAFSSFALCLVAFALVLSAAHAVSAQNREKFVISAKAGGVNATTGRAEVRSAPSADWQLLNVTDNLKTGDYVRTGRDGLVEMLLNPGAYLRVAENSEFQLTNNSLEALEIRLIRGIGIIEATGSEDTELAINITTPHAKMIIVRRGLYRVNVLPESATELIVRKGRVLLADSNTKVKSGDKVIFNSTTFSVAKMNKADKQKDDFETWSKERAENLAQANRRISPRAFNSFLSSREPGFSEYLSGLSNSTGVWLFNAHFGCYTFLPFMFGWGSPYGSSYSNAFYFGPHREGLNRGRIINTPPATGPNWGLDRPGSGSNSSGSSGGSPTRTISPPPAPSRDPDSGRPTRKPEPTIEPGRP